MEKYVLTTRWEGDSVTEMLHEFNSYDSAFKALKNYSESTKKSQIQKLGRFRAEWCVPAFGLKKHYYLLKLK